MTSLPWYVGQLMPDIFVPLSVLALEMLALRSEQLGTSERIGLVGVIACAIAFHMSIFALSLSLLAALAVVRMLPVRWQLPRAQLSVPAAAVAAGVALALVSNAVIAGAFAFTPGGFNIMFGRLVEDKLVTRYLDEHCPEVRLRLCQFRGQFGAWGATAGYAWLEAYFFSRQARCYSLFRLSGYLTGGIGAGDVEMDPDNGRFITCLNGFSMGALHGCPGTANFSSYQQIRFGNTRIGSMTVRINAIGQYDLFGDEYFSCNRSIDDIAGNAAGYLAGFVKPLPWDDSTYD